MEILSIRIENIDLHKHIIYIPQAKSGPREQSITRILSDYLAKHLNESDVESERLFPSKKSKTGHTVNIVKQYKRVVRRAGLDPKEVVRHTLRHTVITHLVQSGVDLPTVQRISGHKSLRMVGRYSHQNGEHIKAAMDQLEKRYKKGS